MRFLLLLCLSSAALRTQSLSSANRLSLSRMSRESRATFMVVTAASKKLSPTALYATNTSATVPPYKRSNFNIPNALTVLRIACIPLFCVLSITGSKTAALSVYIASCITDFVDGYIARQLNQTTTFGAFLDPVADKLMVCTALVLLVCQLPVWWFAVPVALSICREIFVSALRELMAEKGKRTSVKVGFLGKVKTALQMISTSMLLAACPAGADFDASSGIVVSRSAMMVVGLVLLYVSTALSVASAAEYLSAAWPTLISDEE